MGPTDTRWLHVVALAVLVATAGCSFLPGGGTPTAAPGGGPSPTPTATATATPTAAPTATTIDYPPGLNAEGYGDRDDFVDGHVARLAGTSFKSVTRIVFDDHTVAITVKGDPERGHVTKVRSQGGEATGEFFYDDGTVDVAREFEGGEMSYREALTYDGQFQTLYWATLSDPTFEVGEDRTVFTYQITGDANGTVRVTGDGLVLSYVVDPDEGPTIRYRVSGVGIVTVEEPAWAS